MSDTAAITTLLHAYGTALKNCSTAEVLSLYTPNGVFMPPNHPSQVGQAALRTSYDRVFGAIKLDITFDIDEIVVASPEWAFARTTAAGVKRFVKGGEESHSNQELFVLQKVGGEWKIARYAFSSMKPLAV
ncbi:hypothetical protein K505DRAFT_345750 [Melanomma pulvis-pyrius CBS 109.77]|uniref:DUF4440 domain-containing protein n=1 Tax=Melanomma pulvis-pyrius CBS 109.77 TaxID=1314802 RepID=A0A6A6XSZ7_9PLEO|nr:hypothetical protein K505DRAFT_345750 [Melanomma pulvis-pyrius CBS 109.77]